MRRILLGVVTASLVITSAASLSARADDVYPSKGDVRRAKQHSTKAAQDVDAIQAELQRTAQQVEAADVALSEAAEAYDEARVELQDSEREARTAQAAAAAAIQQLDGAQRAVGRLAAETYRGGGSVASLDLVLSPTGPDQVLERATMMHALGAERQRTVHTMDDARVAATALQRQAATALLRQQAAARRADAAKDTAAARARTAHALLAQENATRDRLVGELARARRTSVQVERARQEGLEREAERRREAEQEARARREAARQAARDAARDSGGNGNDNDSGESGNGESDNGGGGTGGGGGDVDGGSSSGTAGGGGSAVSFAMRKIGLPYLWGGDGPGSYDCSGLTMRAWARAGVSLAHSSRLQYRQTSHIRFGSIRRGDLIFYATDTSNPSTIHHVTLYAGDGMMIEAPYTGARVRKVPMRFTGRMPYAGRP